MRSSMRNVLIAVGLMAGLAGCVVSPAYEPVESAIPELSGNPVRLIGRFDRSEPGRAAFTWPGSALEFRFIGTLASMELYSAKRVRFQVQVDGETSDLWVMPGAHEYPLVSGLERGEHRVRLTRLGESFEGLTAFTAGPDVDGELLPPPPTPERRLLVLGNSITAGYGVEGGSASCSYGQETSNPRLTYASRAARALGADAHLIAWSGIGVWRGYGEDVPGEPTIIDRYPRTLALHEAPRWRHSRFEPDAILITIGTNDFWTGTAPGYQEAMKRLLSRVRTDFADKPIYLIASPMLTGDARAAQVDVLRSLASDSVHFLDLGKIEPVDGYGCDYHPNRITNRRMANALIQRLRQDLGW